MCGTRYKVTHSSSSNKVTRILAVVTIFVLHWIGDHFIDRGKGWVGKGGTDRLPVEKSHFYIAVVAPTFLDFPLS